MKKAFLILSIIIQISALNAMPIDKKFKLKPITNTLSFTLKIKQNELIVNNRRWDANEYCSEATIQKPELMEVFSIKHEKYNTVIFCPGLREGDLNTIAAFSKNGQANKVQIDPGSESNTLTTKEFEQALEELLAI